MPVHVNTPRTFASSFLLCIILSMPGLAHGEEKSVPDEVMVTTERLIDDIMVPSCIAVLKKDKDAKLIEVHAYSSTGTFAFIERYKSRGDWEFITEYINKDNEMMFTFLNIKSDKGQKKTIILDGKYAETTQREFTLWKSITLNGKEYNEENRKNNGTF